LGLKICGDFIRRLDEIEQRSTVRRLLVENLLKGV
jgi:hypothetical protein